MNMQDGWHLPSRIDALDFWVRTRLLASARALRELFRPSARHWPVNTTLQDTPILAQRRTPLWADGHVDEFSLVAGKVQNLRMAQPAFHAREIPAGEIFSFWRQLGRPTARRGFVEGREIREGCVVPTLAGGICQISNALATAALQAGFELVERHGHTARIEGANGNHAPDVIDATVFWNYVDLKIRAPYAWRLELEMTATELVLTIRGHNKEIVKPKRLPISLHSAPAGKALPTARGCLSCNQTECFRHRPAATKQQGATALLLDHWSPEFEQYLDTRQHLDATVVERFIPQPLRLAFWRMTAKGWAAGPGIYQAKGAGLQNALWQYLHAKFGTKTRQESLIDSQGRLASAYAKQLKPKHTHLVVDQALLPHLELLGALGGRHVEVLATSLPMAHIEARLNVAAKNWADDASLYDFRANAALVRAEQRGLTNATGIITAHAEAATQIATVTRAPITVLPWHIPKASTNRPESANADDTNRKRATVVFPASELGRKGVHELAAALQGMSCRLRVLGTASGDAALWSGLNVEYCRYDNHGAWLADASVVVLPAHVEHNPRSLLAALAAGIPVIATPACGLGAYDGVSMIAAGDITGLRTALQSVLDKQMT